MDRPQHEPWIAIFCGSECVRFTGCRCDTEDLVFDDDSDDNDNDCQKMVSRMLCSMGWFCAAVKTQVVQCIVW